MIIKPISDKSIWNKFFEHVGEPSFHHSWEWGQFQILCGREIERIGLYENDKLHAIALVVKVRSKRGHYLFVPHGPLFDIHEEKLSQLVDPNQISDIKHQLNELLKYLKSVAKREKFWFIRIAPILNRNDKHLELFKTLGFKTAPIYVHAETMWVLDVTQSEDQILGAMRKNTRYAIKLAKRQQISVTSVSNNNAINDFLTLYHQTAVRENFTPYSDKYIFHEFNSFSEVDNVKVFISGFHNSPKNAIPPEFAQEGASKKLAASIIVFSKASGYYHQGASIHTKYPAAYLLQMHAILEAKRRGCKYYSFHGIYDAGRTPRAWEGLSLFKRGFGGFEVKYLFTQDYIISPLYYFSYITDKILSLWRGI